MFSTNRKMTMPNLLAKLRTMNLRGANRQPYWQIARFLVAAALAGLLFGLIAEGQLTASEQTALSQATRHLFLALQGHDLASQGDLWRQRMIGDGQLLAMIWLFGVSIIGYPLVVIIIFLRGFSVGFAIGFTVSHYGWNGVLISSVAILLHALIAMAVLIFAGVFAIRFSTAILRQAFPIHQLSLYLAKYTSVFAICVFGLMVGAAVQAYVAPSVLSTLLVASP